LRSFAGDFRRLQILRSQNALRHGRICKSAGSSARRADRLAKKQDVLLKQQDVLPEQQNVLSNEQNGLAKQQNVLSNEQNGLSNEQNGLLKQQDVLQKSRMVCKKQDRYLKVCAASQDDSYRVATGPPLSVVCTWACKVGTARVRMGYGLTMSSFSLIPKWRCDGVYLALPVLPT
jgi:hypothetical protein